MAATLLFLSIMTESEAATREAALSVRTTDNQTYLGAGSSATYTVTVSNDGNKPARSIVTTLKLGAGLQFASCSDRCVKGVWPKFDLRAGKKRVFTLKARVPARGTLGTRFASEATASAPGTIANATDESFIGEAQLRLMQTDSKQDAPRGDTLNYTLTVMNPGTLPVEAVTLVDDISGGPEFVSADRGGVRSGTTVRWPVFELPAGASETFTLTAKVPISADSGQVMINSATASAPGLRDEAIDQTLATTATGLALTKSDGRSEARPGDQLTYEITVRNTGDVNEPEVKLVDRFGERLNLVALPTGATHTDRAVTWPDFPLAAGASRTFKVVARIRKAGNQALISNSAVARTSRGTHARAFDETRVVSDPVRPARAGRPPGRLRMSCTPQGRQRCSARYERCMKRGGQDCAAKLKRCIERSKRACAPKLEGCGSHCRATFERCVARGHEDCAAKLKPCIEGNKRTCAPKLELCKRQPGRPQCLPYTGGNVLPLGGVALLLLAVGAAAIVGTRRPPT